MMNNLTKEDINNILVLISKASISGNEALPVAQLQIKLSGLLKEFESPADSKKVDEKSKK